MRDLNEDSREFLSGVADLIAQKNGDYRSEGDYFAGFNEVADSLGLTFEQVWAVYFMKHVRAVLNYCAGQELSDETIESRLQDIAAYAALLHTYRAARYDEDKSNGGPFAEALAAEMQAAADHHKRNWSPDDPNNEEDNG